MGGNKTCGKCKVKLDSTDIPISPSELDLLSEEEIKNGYRLACFINLNSDTTIKIFEEGQLEVVTEGMDLLIDFDPAVKQGTWNIDQDTQDNNKSYLELLNRTTKTYNTGLQQIQDLSEVIGEKELSFLSYKDRIVSISRKPLDRAMGWLLT